MKALTAAEIEFEKLLSQRFPYVMLTIVVLVEIIMAFVRTQASDLDLLTRPTAFELTAFVSSKTVRIAAFILLAFSAMSISSESSLGTLRTVLVKPFRRQDFILGKTLTMLGMSLIVVFVIAIVGIIIGGIYGDFTALTEGEYVIYSLGRLTWNFVLAVLLTVFPLYALCTFGIVCSVLTESSGVSVIVSIGCYFLLEILGLFEATKNFLLGSFISFPMNYAESMAKGLPVEWMPDALWCLGNSISYSAIFLVLSLAIFQRKDIL